MYVVDSATDNSAWNTPADLASDRGQYELRVTFNATDPTQAGMLANMAILELEHWETEIRSVALVNHD